MQDAVAAKFREWIFGGDNLHGLSAPGDGLRDWSISRTGPCFGFEIPGEDNLFFHVWLDAPLGYIATLQHSLTEEGSERRWQDDWQNDETEILHVIGKDITGVHGVFWPALLLAGDCRLPDRVQVHGFLNIDGAKMSKSRGNSVLLNEVLDQVPPCATRSPLVSAKA